MTLYYVVLIYYNQKEWYNNLRSEDTASDIRKVENKSAETFDVFKEKLSKADDYLCTFTKDYFEIEWSESEAEYVVDKTAEHTEVLWIEEEGNQIYGESERLRSEGADVTTEYINGLNNSVYESITTTPWTTSQTVYSYDDYGNTEDVVQGYGYNGERRDQNGLIYLRARYYNPKIGRFIQIDSYRGEKEQPDTQNRYIYTLNNPYKYTDPSGHIPWWEMSGMQNPNQSNTTYYAKKKGQTCGFTPTFSILPPKKLSSWLIDYGTPSYAQLAKPPGYTAPGDTSGLNMVPAFIAKPPPPPPPCPDIPFGNSVLDYLQIFLDLAGIIPAVGLVADILNSLIYYGRSMIIDAIITVGCAVFDVVGDVILKPIKWAAKSATDAAAKIIKQLPNFVDMTVNALIACSTKVNSWKWVPDRVKVAIAELTTSFTNKIKSVFAGAGKVVDQVNKIIASSKNVIFNDSSVDKAFGKHGSDFGSYPDGTKESVEKFKQDIKKLIDTGTQKSGSWYGKQGTHIYNSSTKQWVFVNADGTFNTAFKLSDAQYKYLIDSGVVR